MLMAFTWLLLGGLIGTVAFFSAGLVGGLVTGGDVRDRVGRWYIDMAMASIRDAALTVRETGALTITSVGYDPKFGGDRATIDGVIGHWRDPLEVKSTLSGKPFGIGLESASTYVSPLAAELGSEGTKRLESDWLGSSKKNGTEEVTLDFSIKDNPQLLDLRAAKLFLQGSCKRRWGALANKWGELSQEKFHDRVSLGQSMLWIGAFAAGVGMAFLVLKYGGGSGGGGGGVDIALPTVLPAAALLASHRGGDGDGGSSPIGRVFRAVTSTRAKLLYLLLAGVAGGIGIIAAAYLGWGLWSGIAASVGLVLGLVAPWIYVRVLFAPLGGPIATAFFVLAQLTFGAGALVRRDDGNYEWSRLRQDDDGLFTKLSNGRHVRIEGDKSDLPSVAWAPLAVIEEKTERNMSEFTVDSSQFNEVRPDPADHGESVVSTPIALADGGQGWHLDATKLERWARGSAGSELPRNGLRKALEEEGGQQKISPFITMIGAAVLLVLGFGMTAVVMAL